MRFLLGAAGTGKTFRCLEEIQRALSDAPEGPPLLLIAPKQMTYQLERKLLAGELSSPAGGGHSPALSGFTRLQILSFERLAFLVYESLAAKELRMLDEEGRMMVLRGLLARKRENLQLFRASARLTGFAGHLSKVLRELQRQELTPERLQAAASGLRGHPGLARKLSDLATMLGYYLDWLADHNLQDADHLLTDAASALDRARTQSVALPISGCSIWVDGFLTLSRQELQLLKAAARFSSQTTVTFCLESVPGRNLSWLSSWFAPALTFEECRKTFGELTEGNVQTELLDRSPDRTRFVTSPWLAELEQRWTDPQSRSPALPKPDALTQSLRVAACPTREAEVTLAAREILRFVRQGGRYRQVAVLARDLEPYHHYIQRIFGRYEVPFFLDRRESVAHHPLAELTRSALRTVAFQWQHEDWFAALKTGLVPAPEDQIDRLENEALARGWQGTVWLEPITIEGAEDLTIWLNQFQKRLLPPFHGLLLTLRGCRNQPSGPELAAALRQLWSALKVEERLQEWSSAPQDGQRLPPAVHTSVWEQMNTWLENVEMAFPTESLTLREWLPILDSGLAGLSVGVIPPALDQALIGTVDRSRNPESRLVLVLGMNESVFPAPASHPDLLTESDRQVLEARDILPGTSTRQHLARERFHAYVACTRAQERLVLTYAQHDEEGSPLSPSPFLGRLQQVFPALAIETEPPTADWLTAEHPAELLAAVLTRQKLDEGAALLARQLADFPRLRPTLERLKELSQPPGQERLSPANVERLYGPVLRSSVSRLEQFAACPFRFFVHSGLRAEERKTFELDVKEQGLFQHDVLALFHEELKREGKEWRDITPLDARKRVGRIAEGLVASYRHGLLQSTEQTRFTARMMVQSLQDFVEVLVGWMQSQYRFSPLHVELAFGLEPGSPPWTLKLPDAHRLELNGRIDRIDVLRRPDHGDALCVVVDYKSSEKKLDATLMHNGLQLQLMAYLNVVKDWPQPNQLFQAERLVPAGVFYVNLRGRYERGENRTEALQDLENARRLAYRHHGRFDAQFLRHLDAREGHTPGDQFAYRLTKSGEIYKSCPDPVPGDDFRSLLQHVETLLQDMGSQIYAGNIEVAPYRKGKITACDQCSFASVCRIDPWTHRFRSLRSPQSDSPPQP